jgi:flagellar hook-length control protein FliK
VPAQSTHAAPRAAAHSGEGSSPAAGIFGRRGAKKARGLAAVFEELLSQAQKNRGSKGAAAQKSLGAPLPETATSASRAMAHRASDSRLLQGGSRGPHDLTALNSHGTPKSGQASSAQAAAAATAARLGLGPNDAASVSTEKSLLSGKAHEAAHKAMDKAPDAKAGTREAREEAHGGRVDPNAGALAALAPPLANAVHAKASSSTSDADSSIDKREEKRISEPKVSVLDLRRSSQGRLADAVQAAAKPDEAPKEPGRDAKDSPSRTGRESYRELTLDAGASASGRASRDAGKAETSLSAERSFQTAMAERMRDAWNGEIVQNARIVLRDGDAGTIRLRLRPESLGNVKIELNLSENNIRGKIVVETDEAKSAFERNMNELADAFRQGGFDTASLEVSVGGGGASAGGQGSQAGGQGGPFFSERLRSAVASPADPATSASAYARRGGAVDILA